MDYASVIPSVGIFANLAFYAIFVAVYPVVIRRSATWHIAYFFLAAGISHALSVEVHPTVNASGVSSILILSFLFGNIYTGFSTLAAAMLANALPPTLLPLTGHAMGPEHIITLTAAAAVGFILTRNHQQPQQFSLATTLLIAVTINAISAALSLLSLTDTDGLDAILSTHLLQTLTTVFLAQLLHMIQHWDQQQDLQHQRDREFEILLNSMDDGYIVLDREMRILECNPAALRICEAEDSNALIGESLHRLLQHPQPLDLVEHSGKALEGTLMTRAGQKIPVRWRALQFSSQQEPKAFSLLITNLSIQKNYDEQLSLIRMVFDASQDGILIFDQKYLIAFANERVQQITGYTAPELLGASPKILRSPMNPKGFEDHALLSLSRGFNWEGDIWIRHKNGEDVPCHARLLIRRNAHAEITHYIGVLTDMSDLMRTREALTQQSQYDHLTQLPNRAYFVARLERELSLLNPDTQSMAIVALDIRNFRHINNSLGHLAGDNLLRLLAARIRELEYKGYRVARLGGDEFLLSTIQENPQINLYLLLDHIAGLVKEPFALQGETVYLALSTGITVAQPHESAGAEILIQQADTALNEARQSKNSYAVFQSKMEEQAIRTLTLSKKLKMAIENGAIEVYYQPKVSLSTYKIEGFEALARWRDVDGKFISPAVFIPLAEQSGMIHALFQVVLQKTLRDMSQAFLPLNPDLEASVNLSVQQFQILDLVEQIVRRVDYSGISRRQITVEITESVFADNFANAQKILDQFRQEDILVALDDFGTRFSSLTYLRHLPVQILKVDKSFIDPLPGDARMRAMMEAVMTLCRGFGLNCVVEGVESVEQLQYIQTLGCQSAQGYFFSPPVDTKKFTSLLMMQNEGKTLLPINYEPVS